MKHTGTSATEHATSATADGRVAPVSRNAERDLSSVELEHLVEGPRGHGWKRTARPYLILSDIGAISAALFLIPTPPMLTMVGMYAGVLIMLTCLGAYRSRLTLSALDDLPVIVIAALVGGFSQMTVRSFAGEAIPPVLVVQAFLVAAAVALGRSVAYIVVREARRRGVVEHRAIILGAGMTGQEIARTMLAHPEFGLRPVGFLDSHVPEGAETLPVPLLGKYEDLRRFVRREGVSEVVVAFGAPNPNDAGGNDALLVTTMRECDRLSTEIFAVPRFFELTHRSRDIDQLWSTPLMRLRRNVWRSNSWRVKRAFDVVTSGAALVLLAPLMAMVALAVRIENGPGVLFRQTRVGLDGINFTVLKFRSVRPESLGMSDEKPVFSVNGHAGLGPFSAFMRKTSLDELPQLLNIFRGDMSIVGPRPERDVFVEQFSRTIPRYAERHRAPVGLTGWAQVNGLRGNTSIEERVQFDNYYIQNWSLWFDVKIIARTVSSVVFTKGS
ncbi:sugar transferase [Nocardioides sp.]|uniref:sugar transferase n=1 Tax=Nocardioides sp. TaxID=35761 RepID=UPI002B26B411|nr:sugar transferase [Nocardioides sp.]